MALEFNASLSQIGDAREASGWRTTGLSTVRVARALVRATELETGLRCTTTLRRHLMLTRPKRWKRK